VFRSVFVPALAASGATALLGACDKNGGAAVLTSGSLHLSPLDAADRECIGVWHNWSGGQSCIPAGRFAVASEDELAALIRRAQCAIRPVGSGHSFSALVPTDDHINAARVSLGALGVITRVRTQNRKAFRLRSKRWIQNTEELLDDMPRLIRENGG